MFRRLLVVVGRCRFIVCVSVYSCFVGTAISLVACCCVRLPFVVCYALSSALVLVLRAAVVPRVVAERAQEGPSPVEITLQKHHAANIDGYCSVSSSVLYLGFLRT